MPLKSIREMSQLEREHYSLESRVFRSIALHSILLGLICFALGFGMYLYGLAQESMDEAAALAQKAAASIKTVSTPARYAEDVMKIYAKVKDGASDNARYYEAYKSVINDPGYQRMHLILKNSRADVMSDFFFAVPSPDDGVLVFVADTDPREGHQYPAGRAIKLPGFLQKLFFRMGSDGQFPRTFFYVPGRSFSCISGAYINGSDYTDGCLFVMTSVGTVLKGVRSFALVFTVIVLLVIVIVGVLFVRRIRKSVVQPINQIAEAAQNYVRDKKEGKEITDHFSLLNIRTGDEIENLSLIMADMERDIDSYTEDLTEVTAEKARIGSELDMAAQIQAAVLPHIFPPYPDRCEFDIYASMEPAKEVGGDFYDFFLIDDDHLCLVMADVSGKGVPASLFMMISKVLLQSFGMQGKPAAEILTLTNKALCTDNQLDMFVTCWLGILELSTGKVTAVNAGHEYPAIKKPDGAFELLKDKHGFPLGGFDDEEYESYELQLMPGSKIFVYTDGVAEAMDKDRNQYGLDRMLEALNERKYGSPEKVLGSVRESVRAFVKDADQFDDLTMLCLDYKGK